MVLLAFLSRLLHLSGTKEGMVQIIWDGNNTKDKPQLATTGAGDESDCFSACNDSRIAALIVRW